MNREEQRYAAVSAQITQLLDAAKDDTSPATALLRAQLVAEMYTRNEQSHLRAMMARVDILTALDWRIQVMQQERDDERAEAFVQWLRQAESEASR